MKHLYLSFVLSFTFLFTYSQFGLLQDQYLAKIDAQEEVSIIVKGNLSQIKAICESMRVNLKYAYKDLAAVSIAKNKLDAFYLALDGATIQLPLAKASILMDTALIHNNVVPVHSGLSPLLQAYTGKGVIIGILDSGIYFEHPDFKNADGTTRIRYIWDQNITAPSNPPAPYNFGQEWSWQDIDNGSCNHVEPASQFGHGTTVAGAACGNGLATGTHKGVAPDCEIIAVAVDYYGSDFLSNTVDAIDYVFKKADALGKPCVINTSFGTYFGSHDGKDLSAQLIDALIEERPGRALVASAGNGNNINQTAASFKETHLSYTLSSDTNFTWFRTMSSGQVYFDLWSDTANFSLAKFAMGNSSATTFQSLGNLAFMDVTDFAGNLQQGVYLTKFAYDDNSVNYGQVEMYLEEFEGTYHLEFLVTPVNITDLWRFQLTGQGTFDIWSSSVFQGTSNIVLANLPPNFVLPAIDYYKLPDNEKCIVSSWQCSDKVITVGNFATRSHYFDVDSVYRDLNLTPGEIYYKSSEGPTRDNRLKPDISATGNIIFASGNLDFIASALAINRPKVAPGAMHNYNGGTSMSSPIVAGAVALYLEKNPNAWWYEIKEALAQTALRDTFTGPSANTRYGEGKLDAFALMQFDAVLGCMDDTMFNYNPNANVDDASCIPFVYGCTDNMALNFDTLANTNDGSCIQAVLGCMDSLANNYNPSANVADGSCTYDPDTTGIEQIVNSNLFGLHPNPTSNFVVITCEFESSKGQYQILIVDLLGKEQLRQVINKGESKINVKDLSAGIYWVNLIQNEQLIGSKKLIIE